MGHTVKPKCVVHALWVTSYPLAAANIIKFLRINYVLIALDQKANETSQSGRCWLFLIGAHIRLENN